MYYIYIKKLNYFECIHPTSEMFERCVFPSVFIEFTNEKLDSTDVVPGYIHGSPIMKLNQFL